MILRAFIIFGKKNPVFVERTLNFTNYAQTLRDYFCSFSKLSYKEEIILEQNTSYYTSPLTKICLLANIVVVLDSSAKFSDLNSLESLRSILARQGYDGGKQDRNVEELTWCVMEKWERNESNLMITFVNESMQNRCISVSEKSGVKTKYWRGYTVGWTIVALFF